MAMFIASDFETIKLTDLSKYPHCTQLRATPRSDEFTFQMPDLPCWSSDESGTVIIDVSGRTAEEAINAIKMIAEELQKNKHITNYSLWYQFSRLRYDPHARCAVHLTMAGWKRLQDS